MKSGYRILWTDNAISELEQTIDFLKLNWTNKEIEQLIKALNQTVDLISIKPRLFPVSYKSKVRKAVVDSLNTIYFRENENSIEILSFFSNRQHPSKRKI